MTTVCGNAELGLLTRAYGEDVNQSHEFAALFDRCREFPPLFRVFST